MFEYLRLLNILSGYRTREGFLAYVNHNSPFSYEKKQGIILAYEQMERQFDGVRRESGGPYMDHLRTVATIEMVHLEVVDADEVIAALLHDATEHFPETWPNRRVGEEYGSQVAYLVDVMSKPSGMSGETEEERIRKYHERFRTAGREAVRLKMCDWMHNILTLIYCAPEKQRRKWFEALQYALPRAFEQDVLYRELWTALYSPVLFAFCPVPGPHRP